jgi:hypothetical protein
VAAPEDDDVVHVDEVYCRLQIADCRLQIAVNTVEVFARGWPDSC